MKKSRECRTELPQIRKNVPRWFLLVPNAAFLGAVRLHVKVVEGLLNHGRPADNGRPVRAGPRA